MSEKQQYAPIVPHWVKNTAEEEKEMTARLTRVENCGKTGKRTRVTYVDVPREEQSPAGRRMEDELALLTASNGGRRGVYAPCRPPDVR